MQLSSFSNVASWLFVCAAASCLIDAAYTAYTLNHNLTAQNTFVSSLLFLVLGKQFQVSTHDDKM